MEQNTTSTLVNHGARWGAILAGVTIVLVMLLYAIDYTMMAGFTFIIIATLLGIGMVIYAGINYRNQVGGYLSFGKAYLHGLLVFAVAGLISTAFNFLLYFVIDPELANNMTEAIISNTERNMENWGAPPDSIDQTIEKMREDMPQNFTSLGFIKGYFTGLIWYIILSLITGLIVKKNQPEMV
jgi:TM2 domain-containing membrane protein YozV